MILLLIPQPDHKERTVLGKNCASFMINSQCALCLPMLQQFLLLELLQLLLLPQLQPVVPPLQVHLPSR